MAQPAKPSMGCGYLVIGLIVAVGLAVVWSAQTAYRNGQSATVVAITAGFGILTIVAGFAAAGPIRRSMRRQHHEKQMRIAHPDEPWLWRTVWSQPAIESSDRSSLALIWVFAVFWNVVSFPVAIAVVMQPHIERAAYIVLLFPLIGIGLAYAAVHKTIQVRKFGRALFLPSTMPGAIGGYLGGVIQVPARVVIEADARLTLKCVRRITTGSGKNRSTRESVLWEREERIPREKWTSDLKGTEIPVLFHIPAGSEASDDSNANNQVLWRLSAQAEVTGVDFQTAFEVPVFFTGETAPPPDIDRPLLDTYRAAPLDDSALKRSGVTRQPTGFRFTSSHMTGSRIVFSIIALVAFGLLAAFWNGNVPGVVWVVVGIFAVIFGMAAIDLWVGASELRVEAGEVVVRTAGVWGTKEIRIPRDDVARIEPRVSMTAGSTEYYRLNLIGRQGVDAAAPAPGEHFQARRQRYRLRRLARQLGVSDPAGTEQGARILAAMARTPRFSVQVAKHIPGRATAEAVAQLVMRDVARNS